ncbi:MAG: hypothetical protein DLM67_19710 [Candidatus Nephthysia bennettiae]|uniref:DUF5615 family PIN-like protein n=1 Tax=Candidatus Nephthysia bennettiae TaxID=3127016 RepID=A0A934K5L2_9BACT|nr:DUF5615 family PIN-like protein [Candidatus Dormibacteraeota bacterium]MBJ7611870.1 DUF5615 family PIN-like protein [Candidatus Dormibacteraeota bacterium]PZR88978.1 MAG: hypothetical protein DLM67_19710 [Candidatus Dormibacteraeota bacterium]
MKILLDEMLDASIAEQLCRRGYDAMATQGNAQLQGKQDRELLRGARKLGRLIVTDNVADFARLHRQCLAEGEDHAGIILVSPARYPRSKRTIGIWVEGLTGLLQYHAEASLENTCTWLS